MQINFIPEIIRDSCGLWMSGLFSAISGWNPHFTFEDQKSAFFYLIEKLLNEGKIKFYVPKELWNGGNEIWEVEPEIIVSYLRRKWPNRVSSENDIALTNYFYDMPAIIWVDEDGSFLAS